MKLFFDLLSEWGAYKGGQCVRSIKNSTNNLGLQGQIFSVKFNSIPDF